MANRTIWAARFVVFVAFLDLFMQFPVVAPFALTLGASATLAGIIVAAYSATNLVGNLIAGAVLDRWGRKAPVLAGLIMTATVLVGYALAASSEQLLIARAAHGFAAAVLTPGAFTIIGDSASSTRRARAMGISGAIIALSAVAGPPLAGSIRDRVGVDAVFLTSAALMLVAALVFGLLAREAGPRPGAEPLTPSLPRYLAVWSNPRLVAACLAALALTVSLGALITHLPLSLVARGESASRIGLAFTIYAAVAMAAMAGPFSRLSDRYGRTNPIGGGLLLLGVGMISLGTVPGTAGVALGMAVFGFGFGLLFPAATALVTDAAARGERGSAFGTFYAVYSLGVVIGSVLSGLFGDWFGGQSSAPFLVGAATALLAAPVVWVLGRRAGGRSEAVASRLA